TLSGSAGLSSTVPLVEPGGTDVLSPNIGMGYSQTPTITYQPLQGEDFLKKILAPIPLEALLILTQSGWKIDRVLSLISEKTNDVANAPSASGPTPLYPPRYQEFKEMAAMLRSFQKDDALIIETRKDQAGSAKVHLSFKEQKASQDEINRFCSLLGLSAELSDYIITDTRGPLNKNKIILQTRSMMGVLFLLGQNINIPQRDIDKGLVTITRYDDGQIFNWSDVTGDLLQIHSSAEPLPPENTFVRVRYRNAWYFIKDEDLNSKSTFMLLNQLFNLQAGEISTVAPTLTIPVN
ncbi:MAG: hypothetical protein AAF984_11160, partial [Verrucomicrobiota bacterium]